MYFYKILMKKSFRKLRSIRNRSSAKHVILNKRPPTVVIRTHVLK